MIKISTQTNRETAVTEIYQKVNSDAYYTCIQWWSKEHQKDHNVKIGQLDSSGCQVLK